MENIIKQIILECNDQDKKWGIQNHNVVEWNAILTEEVGEVSKESVDFHFQNGKTKMSQIDFENLQYERIENLKKELVQVAAVSIQFIKSINRQTNENS